MIEKEMLGMIVSETVFRLFGFGPSRSICDEFAGQVIEEARRVHYEIRLPGPVLEPPQAGRHAADSDGAP